jgi:hypothetical protein
MPPHHEQGHEIGRREHDRPADETRGPEPAAPHPGDEGGVDPDEGDREHQLTEAELEPHGDLLND